LLVAVDSVVVLVHGLLAVHVVGKFETLAIGVVHRRANLVVLWRLLVAKRACLTIW
jgi:hypothetical protein